MYLYFIYFSIKLIYQTDIQAGEIHMFLAKFRPNLNILKISIIIIFSFLFCSLSSFSQSIPTLNAVFIPLPSGITSTTPNSIVSGIKTAFSVSTNELPVSSRNFDDSITITDSQGMTFTIDTEVVSTEINFPSNPSVNFIFNTEVVPSSVATGSAVISLKSAGITVANVTTNVIQSDILNPDSANSPSLQRFKLRRHGRDLKLIIKGKNLSNKKNSSFSTIPASKIKRVKIRTNKKGNSRMIAKFSIPSKNLSRVIFTISTPSGQVSEKINLADPAFRKEKDSNNKQKS
jgi:hypothetical protein